MSPSRPPLLRALGAFGRSFLRGRTGSAAMEYGIIAGLLAASIAASLGVLASELATGYGRIAEFLN